MICTPSASSSLAPAPVLGRFRGSETATIHLLIIADCPSHTAVHRRRSGLSCCRCPHLEQSASTRHVRTLYVCFSRTPEGFSLQVFLSLTRYRNFCRACAVTVVIFGHFNRSFYLLTYLLTTHVEERSLPSLAARHIKFCLAVLTALTQ